MEVLILSKTKFGANHVCVGGVVLQNHQYIRLVNPGGYYQYANTPLNIGDIWDITFLPGENIREPHNEDVIITGQRFVRTITNMTQFIQERNLPIWRGHIDNIFDARLRWANSGSGFLSVNHPNFPTHSVGFWISDQPLNFEHDHYHYPTGNFLVRRKLKYKGVPEPLNPIPANTLIRVSLAKWWSPSDEIEERCYLQLSGWY